MRNAAYAALAARAQRRAVPLADEGDEPGALQLADPGDDPEVALIRTRERARLDALLERLPVELRETLVLRELEEMPYRDIARVTGAPIGTVMSRLWRARRMLVRAAAGRP